MENIDEEWKEIWKSEYLKTIAAFHNTVGGRFIIGRRDNGTYIGVSNPHDVLKAISDSIRTSLGISVDIRIQSIEGKMCIVADVPSGRPVVDYNGKYYERIGNTTQQILGERLKDIILSERNIHWMDQTSGLIPSELSVEAVRDFIHMGKGIHRIPEDVDPDDVDSILHRYGLLLKDGTVSITGSILFSEHPRSINRGAFLKIGEFDSDGVLRREDIIDTPVIELPNRTMDMLFDRYIPPRFTYDGALRKLSYAYPVDGLRELIVNAVVHMDYRVNEPVTVSIYPDYVEVFCYGGLPDGWTVETLMGRHRSIPRNKTMADVFHDAGYVENWAQGIRKVITDCEGNGNPPPEFVLENDGLSAIIRPSSDAGSGFTVRSVIGTLTSNQIDILTALISNPGSSGASLADVLDISSKTVNRNLKVLHGLGLVNRDGERSHVRWFATIDASNIDGSD